MFGRRKREQAAAAEAAREAERRELFAKLAERPEHICPFLGLAQDRAGYVEGVSEEHRCYAFGDPAALSAEQQTRVCQERGYGNCPRYLRGVLVIPTEELEALRRPRPAGPAAPPPPPAPEPAPARRRRPLVAILAVLILLVAVGAGAWAVLGGLDGFGVARETASPSPIPTATASEAPSVAPTTEAPTPSPTLSAPPTETPEPTPIPLPSAGSTIPPLPTPAPDGVPSGFAVIVTAGDFPVVRVSEDGTVGDEATAQFSRVSGAPVERIEVDGTVYWRTLAGDYTGLAYVDGVSGGPQDFGIFETFENPDGTTGFVELPAEER